MGNAIMPISVVDDGNHLLGMISSKMVINSLANDNSEEADATNTEEGEELNV